MFRDYIFLSERFTSLPFFFYLLSCIVHIINLLYIFNTFLFLMITNRILVKFIELI